MLKSNVITKLIEKAMVYLVIILILLITICINNSIYIIPSIILYIFVIIYAVWSTGRKKAEVEKHIQELTFDVNSAIKNTVIKSPFPLIIMETDGKIVWKGNRFIQEFANIDIKSYLMELSKEIKQEIQKDSTIKIDKEITVGDKTYKVLGHHVKTKQIKKKSQEYLLSLYFIDQTEYKKLTQKYKDINTCVGMITIDNYEEVIQRIPSEEKTQVLAEAESIIYEWMSQTGGLVLKSERETYIIIFEEKYLEVLEKEKFSILDKVKTIRNLGKAPITLSISITNEGENYINKYNMARAGMDIALGRGGDQAVIKKDSKYKFFGGRAQEVEKRTKVKARTVSSALEELILDSEQVIVMGHTNADIDSIGSSLGIYRFAKELGKPAYIVYDNESSAIEIFMKELLQNEEYKEVCLNKNDALAKITENTVLVIVDTHKVTYTDVPELIEKTEKIVVIDHHRKSTDFVKNATLVFHEVYASSAAELVTEILQYSDKEIELKEIETASLYAGIMMDTKNFTFKTGVRTFEAAAFLRKYGVDIIKVKKWFQSDLENYSIISDIVKNAEVFKENIGIAIYEGKEKDSNIICAKAADELLSISNITASFVIGYIGDKINISGRSIGDINVQIILEKLGGGGHINNAGAQIEGMKLENVKEKLEEKIKEYFAEM